MNTFYEHRSCSPSLTAKNFTGATPGCRQRSSLVGTNRGSSGCWPSAWLPNGTVTGRGRGSEPGRRRGGRIRYKLGTAEFSIALSAVYQLLLLNPQRGCAILSGLREWERSRRLKDTWAANTPCWAALGELGWEGCSDKDILMSSCGMNPATTASPRSTSPAKPAPAEKPKPRAVATPKPTQSKKTPPPKRKSFESGSSSLSSDQALPRSHGKGKGKQP